MAQGDESILESHRREIVVVFCDVRGFTAFAERAEPEEVMAFLRDYHAALGPIVARFEGTLDHYSGDGVMVFFNDPLPTPEPAKRAIEMAAAMARHDDQAAEQRTGRLRFLVPIAVLVALVVTFAWALNRDPNTIPSALIGQRVPQFALPAVQGRTLSLSSADLIGEVSLKGLSQAVAIYNVVQ